MKHPAQEVPERIVSILSGIEGVKSVAWGRVWPDDVAALPVIRVYVPQQRLERSGGNAPGHRRVKRTEQCRVVLVSQGPSVSDAQFEAWQIGKQEQIEKRVCSNPHLKLDDGLAYARDTELESITGGFDAENPRIVITAFDLAVTIDHREGDPRTVFTRA